MTDEETVRFIRAYNVARQRTQAMVAAKSVPHVSDPSVPPEPNTKKPRMAATQPNGVQQQQ
eukprot:16550-Eustigmatos_ZCMA.PRE.1